jgi:hypothetical protein
MKRKTMEECDYQSAPAIKALTFHAQIKCTGFFGYNREQIQ